MGDLEERIIKEIEQNKEFREYLNEQMRKHAERMRKIRYFSPAFREYMERIAKGEIKIW